MAKVTKGYRIVARFLASEVRGSQVEASMMRRAFAVTLAAAAAAVRGWTQADAAVEGKIIGRGGKAAAGIAVFLDAHSRQFHQQTKSGSDGYYKFENLVPGHYTLWCELPDYGCIMYPNISLETGQRLCRDFRFSGGSKGCEM